jgi:hypothetical protein
LEIPYQLDADYPATLSPETDMTIHWTVAKNPRVHVFYYAWHIYDSDQHGVDLITLQRNAREYTLTANTINPNYSEVILRTIPLNYEREGKVIFLSTFADIIWYGESNDIDSSERIYPFQEKSSLQLVEDKKRSFLNIIFWGENMKRSST